MTKGTALKRLWEKVDTGEKVSNPPLYDTWMFLTELSNLVPETFSFPSLCYMGFKWKYKNYP